MKKLFLSSNQKLLEIEARDEANNYKTVNINEMASFGFATELQIISNNEDVIAPEVNDLSFDSSAADTTGGLQTVNVNVRATDAFSGVRNIEVYFYLPSKGYLISTELSRQQLSSGDNKDGIYNGTLTFPQGTDSGMWQVAVFVSDSIGNNKNYNTDELRERGFSTQIQIIGKTPSSQTTKKSRRHAVL